jgi:hypothetical protein
MDFLNFLPASLIAKLAVNRVIRYITNPDIKGAAVFIQGYAARLGLGMTLTRNHMVEIMPIMKNRILKGIFIRLKKR